MWKIRLLVIIGIIAAVCPRRGVGGPSGSGKCSGIDRITCASRGRHDDHLNWDADLSGTGPVTFRAYIPADWYNSASWKAGTGVSLVQASGLTYAVSSCADTTIAGISVICAQYSAATNSGETLESLTLSFTLSNSAVTGASRPVRVTQSSGSGGPPNVSTVYVTVAGAPSIRYVGTSDCGGNSPCNTGPTALADAIAALPAAGGTIYVYGAYAANEAALGAKNVILRPVDSGSSLNGLRIRLHGNPGGTRWQRQPDGGWADHCRRRQL